jgi:hypothetical protein
VGFPFRLEVRHSSAAGRTSEGGFVEVEAPPFPRVGSPTEAKHILANPFVLIFKVRSCMIK